MVVGAAFICNTLSKVRQVQYYEKHVLICTFYLFNGTTRAYHRICFEKF